MPYRDYDSGKLLEKFSSELLKQVESLPADKRHLYELSTLLLSNAASLLTCFPSIIPGKAIASFYAHAAAYSSRYISWSSLEQSDMVVKFLTASEVLFGLFQDKINENMDKANHPVIVIDIESDKGINYLYLNLLQEKKSANFELGLIDEYELPVIQNIYENNKTLIQNYEHSLSSWKNIQAEKDVDAKKLKDAFEQCERLGQELNQKEPLYKIHREKILSHIVRTKYNLDASKKYKLIGLTSQAYRIYQKDKLDQLFSYQLSTQELSVFINIVNTFVSGWSNAEFKKFIYEDILRYVDHFKDKILLDIVFNAENQINFIKLIDFIQYTVVASLDIFLSYKELSDRKKTDYIENLADKLSVLNSFFKRPSQIEENKRYIKAVLTHLLNSISTIISSEQAQKIREIIDSYKSINAINHLSVDIVVNYQPICERMIFSTLNGQVYHNESNSFDWLAEAQKMPPVYAEELSSYSSSSTNGDVSVSDVSLDVMSEDDEPESHNSTELLDCLKQDVPAAVIELTSCAIDLNQDKDKKENINMFKRIINAIRSFVQYVCDSFIQGVKAVYTSFVNLFKRSSKSKSPEPTDIESEETASDTSSLASSVSSDESNDSSAGLSRTGRDVQTTILSNGRVVRFSTQPCGPQQPTVIVSSYQLQGP